jgi:serine/threonine-protein kinase
MCAWVLGATHVADPEEVLLLFSALSFATFGSAAVWCLYIAIEPYLRRNWPDALISWTRLQAGRFRDPLVASHILVGILLAVALFVPPLVPIPLFGFGKNVFLPDIPSLGSAAYATANILAAMQFGIFLTFLTFALVTIVRLLVRRAWVAFVLVAVLFGAILQGPWLYPEPVQLWGIVAVSVLLWGLGRFGMLAMVPYFTTGAVMRSSTASLGSWYAGRSVVILLIPAAIAAWALWAILSAQRQPSTESAG